MKFQIFCLLLFILNCSKNENIQFTLAFDASTTELEKIALSVTDDDLNQQFKKKIDPESRTKPIRFISKKGYHNLSIQAIEKADTISYQVQIDLTEDNHNFICTYDKNSKKITVSGRISTQDQILVCTQYQVFKFASASRNFELVGNGVNSFWINQNTIAYFDFSVKNLIQADLNTNQIIERTILPEEIRGKTLHPYFIASLNLIVMNLANNQQLALFNKNTNKLKILDFPFQIGGSVYDLVNSRFLIAQNGANQIITSTIDGIITDTLYRGLDELRVVDFDYDSKSASLCINSIEQIRVIDMNTSLTINYKKPEPVNYGQIFFSEDKSKIFYTSKNAINQLDLI
ncbi:MAG: hypothetical protein KDD94_12090, partial [Calditrichaeota bacterium]|nr:hypothetical protein [Calditrichota bacterium]